VDAIRRAWATLFLGGLAAWLTTILLDGEGLVRYGIVVAPSIMIVMSIMALTTLIRDNALNLSSPVGPLSAAIMLYFGVGGLVPVIADSATNDYIHQMYNFTDAELLVVHGICALGIFVLAGTGWLRLRGEGSGRIVVTRDIDPDRFRRAVLVLYITGMFVTLTLSLPNVLGLVKWTAPSAIVQLGRLASFALLLIGFGLARGLLPRPTYLPLFLVTVAVLVGGGVLALNKTEIFLQAVAAIGGFILANPSRRFIGIVVGIGVALFVIMTPLILIARVVALVEEQSLSGRIEAAKETIALGDRLFEAEDAPNPVLARIQYVNAIAWGRNEYVAGRAGTSLTSNALWIFVPRSIWPDKPVMSNVGREVTNLTVSYESTSNTGLTGFGEAYWNAGYAGLVFASALLGLMLSQLTVMSFRALTTMDIAGIIWVWNGAYLALRIDGYIMIEQIGQLPILIVTYFLIRALLAAGGVNDIRPLDKPLVTA
jgi:hypothetical protein